MGAGEGLDNDGGAAAGFDADAWLDGLAILASSLHPANEIVQMAITAVARREYVDTRIDIGLVNNRTHAGIWSVFQLFTGGQRLQDILNLS